MKVAYSNQPALLPFGFNDSAKERETLPELYFHATNFNARARDPTVSIIIGRRGAGKTALAQYLKFNDEDPYALYVDIDEPHVFSRVLESLVSGAAGPERLNVVDDVAKVWELALWTALISQLLQKEEQVSSDDRHALRSYLRSINVDVDKTSVVRSVLAGLVGMFHEKAGALIDLVFRVHQQLSCVEFLQAQSAVCRYLDRGPRAVIVIDTLEQYEIRRREMQHALGAMLQAVTQFALGGMHRNLHIKCLLPAEIVPYLLESAVQNPGKTFELPLHLRWRPKDLLRLACWRYYFYLSHLYPKDAEAVGHIDWENADEVRKHVWDRFFPPTITNRNGLVEDSFQYIVRHTQLQPRQVIWICNGIAESAKSSGTFPYFKSADVVRGVHSREDSIANEVLNSYRTVYPGSKHILSCFRSEPNLIGRASRLDKLLPRSKSAWPEEMPYDRALFWQMVAELGFMGSVTEQTDRYYETEFEYAMADRLVLNFDDVCAIHPVFYKLFSIKADKQKIVYPVGPNITSSATFPPR